MSSLYNVVFSGETVAGADPAAVKSNVGRLFRVEGPTLDRLFSGQSVILKKGIDQATAMKIRAAMKQAGAIARLVDLAAPEAPPPSAPAAPAPVTAPVPPPAVATLPAGTGASAGTGTTPASLTVARLGTDLIRPEERQVPEPVVVDLSGMSIAPPRTEILRPEERPVVVPVVVDTSGMSMAPPGAPLEELREERPPVNPDISHLRLE